MQKTLRISGVLALVLLMGAPIATAQSYLAATQGGEAWDSRIFSNHRTRGSEYGSGDVLTATLAVCFDDAIASGDWPNIEAVAAANLAIVEAAIPGTITWANDSGGLQDLGRWFTFMVMGLDWQGTTEADNPDGDWIWTDGWMFAWASSFAEDAGFTSDILDWSANADVEAMYDECLGAGDEGGEEGAPPPTEPSVTLVGAGEVGVNRERLYFAEINVPDGFQDNGDPTTTTEIKVTLTWATSNDNVLVLNDDERINGGVPMLGVNAITELYFQIEVGGEALPATGPKPLGVLDPDGEMNEDASSSYGVGVDTFLVGFDVPSATATVLVSARFECTDPVNNPNCAVVNLEDSIDVTVTRWEWWDGCEPYDAFVTGVPGFALWWGCGMTAGGTNDPDVIDMLGAGVPDAWMLWLYAYALCNEEGWGDQTKAQYAQDYLLGEAYKENYATFTNWRDNLQLARQLVLSDSISLTLDPNDVTLITTVQVEITATSGAGDTKFIWSTSDPLVAAIAVLDSVNNPQVATVTAGIDGWATITCTADGTPLDPPSGLVSTARIHVITLPDPDADPLPVVDCPPDPPWPAPSTASRATAGLIYELETLADLWNLDPDGAGPEVSAADEADPLKGGGFLQSTNTSGFADMGTSVDDLTITPIDGSVWGWVDTPPGSGNWVWTPFFPSAEGLTGLIGAAGWIIDGWGFIGSDQAAVFAGYAGLSWTMGNNIITPMIEGWWYYSMQEDLGGGLMTIMVELQTMGPILTQELLDNGFPNWASANFPSLQAFSSAVADSLALVSTYGSGNDPDPDPIETPGVGGTPEWRIDAWECYFCPSPGQFWETVFVGWSAGDYDGDGRTHDVEAGLVKAAGGNAQDFVRAATGTSGFWKGNPNLPVTGLIGLGLLAGVFAVSGAVLIRKRKS